MKKKLILVDAVILVFVLFLFPTADDWGYFTVPTKISADFFEIIKKVFMHRRSLDIAYGYFLGYFPFLFPVLNHIIVVIAHGVTTLCFYNLTHNYLNKTKKTAFIFALIFEISSTCCATIYSVDALNQSLSLMFGIVGLNIFLRLKHKPVLRTILYLLLSILSLFSKESGIVFFFIIPLFEIVYSTFKKCIKDIIFNYICAGILVGLYGRIYVSGSDVLGNVFTTVRNFVAHIGFSFFQIDTVSLFATKNYVLPVITLMMSMPLVITTFAVFINKLRRKEFNILWYVLFLFASTFPQICLPGMQEMNSYPTVFFAVLLVCALVDEIKGRKLYLLILPYIASALLCSSIKYREMYNLSESCRNVLEEIEKKTQGIQPENILAISVNNFNEDVYGVYHGKPIAAVGNGNAMKILFDWDADVDIRAIHTEKGKKPILKDSLFVGKSDDELDEYLINEASRELSEGKYDLCVIIYDDGRVIVVNDA